jgi:hypothetical protein
MKRITSSQLITILASVITITVNALANILPLNGLTTGEISDRFDIYFVPAGYVFSIWGLIYLGLILYTIFQALPSQRENETLKKIAPAYWLASAANSAWIFLWHYEVFQFTLVAMVSLLFSLLVIYTSLANVTGMIKWLVKLPFSIYLGWITVATVANASQFLYYIDWNGLGIAPTIWAVIMIAVATLLGILMIWRENNFAYVLVLIWAFIGITVSQADVPLVVMTSWVTSILLGVALIANFLIKSLFRGEKR